MSPRALGLGGATAWVLGAAWGLILLGRAALWLRPAAEHDIVTLGLLSAVVFLLGAFGVLSVHRPATPVRGALGLRATHPGFAAFGVALGLALHGPAEALRALIERRFPVPEEELAFQVQLLSVDTPLRAAMLLVVAACVVPLVEELFFRGALYGCLRRDVGLPAAFTFVAIAFTLSHLADYSSPGAMLRTWAPLLPVALVLGWVRAASGSLLPSLALHVAFNALTVTALVSGLSTPGESAAPPPWFALGGSVATLVLVYGVHALARSSEVAVEAREEDER